MLKTKTVRERLLASTMICGALFVAAPAFAQERPTTEIPGTDANPQGAPLASAETEVEEIVVTGSRIRQPNLVTTSPVTQVTGEDIDVAGVTRIEDLVNQLPQAFAAQNSTVANGATGTATVDLRGLGPVRTLVLVDGRRLPYGSPLQGGSAPDLNQIPGNLVERVEVLTGGASAVYGSDALSGVVNFIMRKDFEGIEVDAQYSFYQHNNDNDGPGDIRAAVAARQATNPQGFRLPDDNVDHGWGKQVDLLMGVNAPDDRGNITAYVGYRNNDAILQSEYDYSACSLNTITGPTTNYACGGSGTAFPGTFSNFGLSSPAFNYTIDAQTGNFRTFTTADQYNFGPLNYYQRPDERYNLGAFGRYKINDMFEAYTQLMFTDYETVAQIAPSGNFFATSEINCDNPLLNATQKTQINCTAADIEEGNTVPLFIGRRNVEGGGRQDDLRYQSWRALIGLRGALNENFDYDVAASFSRVTLRRAQFNYFSNTRLGLATDVVTDPESGLPVCRAVLDGTDPNCVPYNVFSIGGVTQEALDYLNLDLLQTGYTEQQVVTGVVTGDLTDYGMKSPWASRGVQVAVGAEYRADELNSNPDEALQGGDAAGSGGATLPVFGRTEVYDLFGEVQIPIAEDLPFAKLITVDAAYRWSDYAAGFQTDTYKVGADWAPTSDIRFRASYQKAVRAPNVLELFLGQGFNLFDLDQDPCGAGGYAAASAEGAALCVATGVPAALVGSVGLNSPAGQYNFLQGGNPNLEPEEGKTTTIGAVFTPTFFDGFTFSVDYFKIEVTNLVGTVGSENILDQCYAEGALDQCARINRLDGVGSLWLDGGFVENLNTNIGGLETSGWDFNATYGFDLVDFGLPDYGALSFNFTGTYLEELVTDTGLLVAGAPDTYDCAGFYAGVCSSNAPPNPQWRHRFRVSYQTPFNVDISGTWRYIDEVEFFEPNTTQRPDFVLEEQHYFDIAGTWRINDMASFRAGVNNVFDRDPPLSASVGTTGNGNTYPQTYDALGRYIFTGITLNF
jgi:iron complex outermembrane recepter protein